MRLVLLTLLASLAPPPMSPSQDARARQMTEAIEAAAKLPQPKPDCVQISKHMCVSKDTLERMRK